MLDPAGTKQLNLQRSPSYQPQKAFLCINALNDFGHELQHLNGYETLTRDFDESVDWRWSGLL